MDANSLELQPRAELATNNKHIDSTCFLSAWRRTTLETFFLGLLPMQIDGNTESSVQLAALHCPSAAAICIALHNNTLIVR